MAGAMQLGTGDAIVRLVQRYATVDARYGEHWYSVSGDDLNGSKTNWST